jgi:hypothetical protein
MKRLICIFLDEKQNKLIYKIIGVKMKKCSKCGVEKEDNCFEKQRAQCKMCRASYIIIRAPLETNKIAKRKTQAKYASSKKGKETDKKYQQSNKGKNTRNLRQKTKRQNNSEIKLRDCMRGSINKSLKRNNSSKNNNSINDYLPYTIKELKKHIEDQFLLPNNEWMNWNNHGTYNSKTWDELDPATWTWNIDHIIPHSDFYYTSMEDQEFKDCWALSNLRPLKSKQNILDGVSRVRHKK